MKVVKSLVWKWTETLELGITNQTVPSWYTEGYNVEVIEGFSEVN